MLRITDEMQFQDETLLLGATIFDRVSAFRHVEHSELQLHASMCVWIACETNILALLRFVVGSTTPLVYVHVTVEANHNREGPIADAARFFCLVMMFCPGFAEMSPSVLGMTAIVLVALVLGSRAHVHSLAVTPEAVMEFWEEAAVTLEEIGDDVENPLPEQFPATIGLILFDVRQVLQALVTEQAVRSFCCSEYRMRVWTHSRRMECAATADGKLIGLREEQPLNASPLISRALESGANEANSRDLQSLKQNSCITSREAGKAMRLSPENANA
jgi:hypothetical protein